MSDESHRGKTVVNERDGPEYEVEGGSRLRIGALLLHADREADANNVAGAEAGGRDRYLSVDGVSNRDADVQRKIQRRSSKAVKKRVHGDLPELSALILVSFEVLDFVVLRVDASIGLMVVEIAERVDEVGE